MFTPDADVVIDAETGVEAPSAGPNAGLPPLLQMLLAASGGLGGLAGLGGQSAGDNALITALLAAQSGTGDNTMLSTLLQALQASRAAAPQAVPDKAEEAIKPTAAEDSDRGMPADADVQALVDHARGMEQEIELLRQRNDSLAAALGACYLCVGQNSACPICQGRGVPGRQAPHPGHFRFWVQPVLDRWMPAFDPAPTPRRPTPQSQAAPAPSASRARMHDYVSAAWSARSA